MERKIKFHVLLLGLIAILSGGIPFLKEKYGMSIAIDNSILYLVTVAIGIILVIASFLGKKYV